MCRYTAAEIRVPKCPMSAQIVKGVLKLIRLLKITLLERVDFKWDSCAHDDDDDGLYMSHDVNTIAHTRLALV